MHTCYMQDMNTRAAHLCSVLSTWHTVTRIIKSLTQITIKEMLSLFSASSSLVVQPIVQAPMHVQQQAVRHATFLTAEADNGIFPSTLLARGAAEATPFEKGGFGKPTAAGDLYQGGSQSLNLGAMVCQSERSIVGQLLLLQLLSPNLPQPSDILS